MNEYKEYKDGRSRENYIYYDYGSNASENIWSYEKMMGIALCAVILALVVAIIFSTSAANSKLEKLDSEANEIFSEVLETTKMRLQNAIDLVEIAEHAGENVDSIKTTLMAIRANVNTYTTPCELDVTNETISQVIERISKKLNRKPEVTTNEEYIQLQENIEVVDKQLSDAKEAYNDIAEAYNRNVNSPLGKLLDNYVDLQPKELFDDPKVLVKRDVSIRCASH